MANDKQKKSQHGPKGGAPELADAELAAMAELASAPLRKVQSKPGARSQPKAKTPTSKPKTTEESVTLPIERTVKAFVQGISPSIEDMVPSDEDGVSLEAALDDFILDAKRVSSSLPPAVVDDKQLANLARVPVAMVEAAPSLPDEERKGTPIGSLILAAGLGAILAVAGVTLMRSGDGPTVPSTPTQPPSAQPATPPVPTTAKLSPTNAEHDAAAARALATSKPATTTKPDATMTKPDVGTIADSTAPAAEKLDAATVKAPVTPPATVKPQATVRTKRVTPKKVATVVKSKRTTRTKKPLKKRIKKKTKTKKKKKKKAGGDWVDPFSQ
ncbi:MAG: hypothetical protein JRH20_01900 [Deltaproteobacteria bacterium]|nr:hypothetical protein [Deltaproteobacteria bacterium]